MNIKDIETRLEKCCDEWKVFGTTLTDRRVDARRTADGLYRVRFGGLREAFVRPLGFAETARYLARRLASFDPPKERKRVRVVNRTCWKTSQLRKIIERIARDEIDQDRRGGITVEVSAARRQDGCSGDAYIRGNVARVRVPTKVESFDPYLVDFAAVVAHELAHCHGHRGERWMRSRKTVRYGRRSKRQDEFYAWVREPEYRVERQEKKTKRIDPGDPQREEARRGPRQDQAMGATTKAREDETRKVSPIAPVLSQSRTEARGNAIEGSQP